MPSLLRRVYFRSIERLLYLATNYPTPSVQSKLAPVAPTLNCSSFFCIRRHVYDCGIVEIMGSIQHGKGGAVQARSGADKTACTVEVHALIGPDGRGASGFVECTADVRGWEFLRERTKNKERVQQLKHQHRERGLLQFRISAKEDEERNDGRLGTS